MAIDPNASGNNSAPVPAQTAPNPTPAPPDVDNASGQPASDTLPVAPGGGAATNPAPPQQGQKMPAETQHGVIGKIFQTIAGGQTTDFANTPNGPVAVKRDLKPGEMARNILGAAFSLLAAGAGGAEAGNERRGPYQQPENESIGGQERQRVQVRQQEAEKEFQNKQQADEATLRAHKDATEQQESIARLQQYGDAHRAFVEAHANDPLRTAEETKRLQDSMNQIDIKNTMEYNKALAMPGAEVMKDANGKELNFANGREAQAYVTAHPEALHGSTNGNTKYGVIGAINPQTGAFQFIDYPADRHDIGIANFGQKKDADGNPVFDKDGNPEPDGTVLDPKTKKPTVLTQTVTPDQARQIAAQNITQANIEAQMADRKAQAKKYDAEAGKNQELSDATDLYAMGRFDQMTDRQKQIMARATFQQLNLDAKSKDKAEDRLTKATQFATGPDDPDVKKARVEFDEAKDAYDDSNERYNKLTGNTPGVQLGNKIVRSGALNKVASQADWSAIDKQITDSGLPAAEAQTARAKAWNAMSPVQQAAASGKAAPAAAGAAPSTPSVQAPPGKAIIFDPQGKPHQVQQDRVDEYLASPDYQGWHK